MSMTVHPGTGVRLDAEGRADFIRDAMEGGTWTRSAELKMMREWNVTAAQMVQSVRKARGLIEEALPGVTDLRTEMILRLRRIIASGEDRDAIKASAEVARLTGAAAPEMDLKQHLAAMSVDERRAYLTRLKATVEKALEALP
jgi:hypothetical protein